MPFSYYRAKLAQERLVEQGPVAWSLVRATQFHELLDWAFSLTARIGIVPALRFPVAPVDSRFVARVLAAAVEAGPGGRLAPVAGPQAAPLGDLARDWTRVRGRRALPLALPLAPGARRALMRGAIVPGDDAVRGGPTFGEWLRARDGAAPPA